MTEVTLENLWLEPLIGDGVEREVGVVHFPFVVGRHASCDYQIEHPYVSRRHCQLMLFRDQVWVQDLGSRNGTFVNGRRVCNGHPLHNGDLISICFHLFRVNVHRPAGIPAEERDLEYPRSAAHRREEVYQS